MTTLNLAIHGAGGRMGQRVVALANADSEIRIVAALEHEAHPQLGTDAGLLAGIGELGVPLCTSLDEKPDVLVDFSVPKAAVAVAQTCAEQGVPLVVATTGLEPTEQSHLQRAGESIPVVWAPSMSLAVNLLMKLSETAASALKDHSSGVDVEILDATTAIRKIHRAAPRFRFGQIISEVMGQTEASHGRVGRPGARSQDEIGYHAIRVGDNPGEHTIIFGLLGEVIELRVAATNRDCYAHGALVAAKFVAQQKPGLYDMADVLGL